MIINKLSLDGQEYSQSCLRQILIDAIEHSRFKADIKYTQGKHCRFKISKIRLRESKDYCGNHPNACQVVSNRKPRKTNFLEGLDWVNFNDMINDVLDEYNISANVSSAVCIIRKAGKRRVEYNSYWRGNFSEWNYDEMDGCYQDYRTVIAPNSEYPEGTPGLYIRNQNIA